MHYYFNEQNMKQVILCDEQGNELGQYDKLQAHVDNKLHKAFSIVVYNTAGDMLIHKRADSKYHTPGLWTNACCSHHVAGEDILVTAPNRLQEEMGFTCQLEELFTFIYQAQLDTDLYEHELDTVFRGIYDGPIDNVNPEEASEARWISVTDLKQEIAQSPEKFTPWFKLILDRLE